MKAIWTTLAAVLFASLAIPASAADLATLGCVREQMKPDMRALLSDSAGKLAVREGSSLPEAARADIHTAALACQTKYHWNDAAVKAAESSTLAEIAYAGAFAQGRKQGIDEAGFVKALHSLSAAERKGIMAQDPPSLAKFVAALSANGLDIENDDKALLLGVMAAFRVLQEDNRALFASA
jgi:hypothetical protein